MLKKTIEYTDYNGLKRKEDFFFNLTETELTEMELTTGGGLSDAIIRITNAQEAPEIIKVFKEIILKAYGVKSPDGRRFEKSEELSKAFSETPAFNKLFMELGTDDKAAAAFINGIMPAMNEEQTKEFEKRKHELLDQQASLLSDQN